MWRGTRSPREEPVATFQEVASRRSISRAIVMRGGDSFARNDIGVEFESLALARAEAQKFLPEIVRDALPDGNHRTFVVSMRDGAGTAEGDMGH